MKIVNVLVVESDRQLTTELETYFKHTGYIHCLFTDKGEDALIWVKKTTPNIIFIDVDLEGALDGFALAAHVRELPIHIPIAFTSKGDSEAAYEKAEALRPYVFLVKPFSALTMRSAIDAILRRNTQDLLPSNQFDYVYESHVLREYLFVKTNSKFFKLTLSAIQWIQADGNYAILHANAKRFVVKISLNQLLEQLDSRLFIRIHRNFVVQITHIDSVDFAANELNMAGTVFPIGSKFKSDLANRLNRIS
jgi:DNA-binding LytR/AlgR family response regulator